MVSCVIINFNTEKLLKSCIESLKNLKYAKKEIIFIDNASSDGSVEFVRKHYPEVNVVSNRQNTGYAGAADQAVRLAQGEFVMLLNPDIVFDPNYLDILVDRLKATPMGIGGQAADKKIGAIIGKLRKYDFTHDKKTTLIDSAGLVMYRNRRCVDRGQGEEDRGQYDVPQEVFGITGACPLYRKSALEDIKIGDENGQGGEYFDSDFFMYKEDVDISWRLLSAGWKCFYEPAALAYHGRGTGAVERNSMLDVAIKRASLSKFQKFYSYKNERLMRIKNDTGGDVLRDIFPIVWKEILMTGWIILREPFLVKSFGKFLMQLPKALRKRKKIMERRKISSIRKWLA